ncbi:MAG: DMT family transporter [Propylenella sp.]
MRPAPSLSENSRGILFMLGAMAGFIVNDTFVKLASEELSVAQILVVRSIIALPFAVLIGIHQGAFGNPRLLAERFIWLRAVSELGAAAFYLTALAHMDIANATAIIQIVPLTATAAAAILLGETVGIRRWTAILIGLGAVVLIIRPGVQGFNAWSLLALTSVGFVVARDLASRMLPADTHPMAVSVLSLVAMIPLGLAMLPFSFWGPLTMRGLLLCAGSGLLLAASYVLITQAMRHGEMAVVSPFRYAILLLAILIQIVVFSVWPDSLTIVGSAILVATGLYTLYRERRVMGAGAALTSRPATFPPPQ